MPGTRARCTAAAVAEAVDVVYKQGRKPMPDLLREQFPHFRPIVEAFGYRNLEFEGWEADDVIATIATRADEAGVKTCVVSTDRDAFQLCSENVTLMMTPRGVSDVNVYTPERVELRYGVRPDQVPDFIGLKGDTSDNIPGIPGIGDKTAGQLVAQYGSLEEVIAHADELSPARGKAVREHADQARASKELATMRRDLPLDVDPTTLVSGSPDRSQLKEMFRRFEFRGLLNRVDELDAALPAQERPKLEGQAVAWREEPLGAVRGRVGVAIEDGRIAVASEDGVVVADWDPSQATLLRDAELVAHDAKALHLPFAPADDTMLAAYLIEPGRSAYLIDDLAAEYGLELDPEPPAEETTASLVRHAEAPRRLAAPMRERARRARLARALREHRAAADRRARGDGGRRRQDRHVPHGRDHGPAQGSGRGARGARDQPRRRGVHARLDPAGGADPVREARPRAGPQGQDGLLDRQPRPARDPRRTTRSCR